MEIDRNLIVQGRLREKKNKIEMEMNELKEKYNYELQKLGHKLNQINELISSCESNPSMGDLLLSYKSLWDEDK